MMVEIWPGLAFCTDFFAPRRWLGHNSGPAAVHAGAPPGP